MDGNPAAPRRGEIWFANLAPLNPSAGAEIQKSRPVLIIGNNIVNQNRRAVLVIPLATSGGAASANPPLTVAVACAGKNGVAVIDQLRALDKSRLSRLMAIIQPGELEAVINAVAQVLEIV